MPQVFIKFISITCHEMEDFLVFDEPYLRFNGETVWNGKVTSDHEPHDLSSIELISFYETAKIELWERDTGFFDDDDFIGKAYVHTSLAGKGEQASSFTGDGANYSLVFEILTEKEYNQ